jgi:hypothetical protein
MRDSDKGLELLRELAGRRDEPAPPQPFRPLRFYRRRTDPVDRTFMRFEHGGRPRCTS